MPEAGIRNKGLPMSNASSIVIEGAEQQPLKAFTEKVYLDYSMYVILDRVLPHIGDGEFLLVNLRRFVVRHQFR